MSAPPWFVVTGCGRSGTGYASALFRALGIACGHEAVYGPWPEPRSRDGLDGDSSWLAAPFLDRLPEGSVVLHQVRDPLAVTRSHLVSRFFHPRPEKALGYVAFARRWCLEAFASSDEATRCLAYWVRWNGLVEERARAAGHAYLRYRLEDVDSVLPELLETIGRGRAGGAVARALAAVPRTTNSWGATDQSLLWSALPAGPERDAAAALAASYGYSEYPGSARTTRASSSNAGWSAAPAR